MNEASTSRYGRERLGLAVSFLLGMGLVYLSSGKDMTKFWEKLSEAVGTALILVVVMDVFFKDIITKLHSMDHKAQQEAREVLGKVRSFLESGKLATKEAQEQMAQSVKTLLEKIEEIDRSLKAGPGS